MSETSTPPNTKHLESLYESLDMARAKFLRTCEDLSDGGMWEISANAASWLEAAEAWNEGIADAVTDVQTFVKAQSEEWQASERGQAYQCWADALRLSEVETEPYDTLRVSLTLDVINEQMEVTVKNADEVLPETPDLPNLSELDN